MICYLFPPLGGMAVPAVQRVVKFVRGMAGSHWDPVILTLRVDLYEPYLEREEKYLREIPASAEVVRTGRVMLLKTIISAIQRLRGRGPSPHTSTAETPSPRTPQAPAPPPPAADSKSALQRFKDALTGAVQTPDPFMGWLPVAFLEGRRTIRQRRIACIYATGSPWTSLLVGALLKKSTGLPLVLDFRDPWTTNPYRMHFHPARRWIEGRLETFVVNSADAVIANTRGLRDEFRARYPRLPSERFDVIYNCVENERPLPRIALRAGGAEPVRLAHAGFLYGPRDPLLLLRAMAKRRQRESPGGARDLILDLIGPIDVSYPIADKLAELGLTDLVHVHGPVPHAMCQDMLVASSALLLLQPGTMTQLPSKLFEYVSHGKPILTLAMPGSETYTFAAEQLGSLVADCDDEEAIVRTLDELIAQVRAGQGPDIDRWEAAMAQFRPHTITSRLLHTFDTVTALTSRRSGAIGGAHA
jgi:Glycosyltransferase Family 4